MDVIYHLIDFAHHSLASTNLYNMTQIGCSIVLSSLQA